MVVAAHPDDEVLGCGGTLAKYSNEGAEIDCLILGEGIASRHASRNAAVDKKIKALKLQCKKAANVLGIRKINFANLPDNRFDTVALIDIIKFVEKLVNKIKPDIIFTHYQYDLNIDHKITFEAVMTACRPLPGLSKPDIYSFEVPSSTEWALGKQFCPNIFSDISATFRSKAKAMSVYEDEINDFPHPRSIKAMEISGQSWGIKSGMEIAEPFMLIRGYK